MINRKPYKRKIFAKMLFLDYKIIKMKICKFLIMCMHVVLIHGLIQKTNSLLWCKIVGSGVQLGMAKQTTIIIKLCINKLMTVKNKIALIPVQYLIWNAKLWILNTKKILIQKHFVHYAKKKLKGKNQKKLLCLKIVIFVEMCHNQFIKKIKL